MTQSLRQYREKRDFRATAEPAGAARRRRTAARASEGLSFVIQRHQARRLHYDFRLEIDGVLVSWAVPKGPSRDPSVKRLAVHVEDHPLEYGGFSGDIPKGQYGAGHVDIWDSGVWIPRGDPRQGLRRGKLHFALHGRRLAGDWVLVRMSGEHDQWLLRKEDDEAAVPGDDAERAPATPPPARGHAPAAAPRGRRAAMPRTLAPQLATLVDSPPHGPGWSYEVKYDGYRILAACSAGGVRLVSRGNEDWQARMAPLARALGALKLGRGWLDGEVVVLDERGVADFQLLQNALDGQAEGLVFVAFDLPFWNGEDLRALPLQARQERLEDLLQDVPQDAPLMLTQRLPVADDTEGKAAWNEACRLSLEGLICKRLDAPYRSGRSQSWLKLKCHPRQEFIVGGYTEPTGARRHLGALLVGLREGRRLRYAGRVGTGFGAATLRTLGQRLAALRQDAKPFSGDVPRGRGDAAMHWVRPELVAEVNYAGITRDGLLRQASFAGLRADKPASEVRGEAAKRPPAARTAAPSRRARGGRAEVAGVGISHPDRLAYREPDYTKLQLAEYYAAIGPHILPHLGQRRVALLRCPDGAGTTCFFQKHLSQALPAGVRRDGGHLVIESLPGLIALVQYGAIEFHTWGADTRHPDTPDRITLDLDPGPGVGWPAIVEGAQMARLLMQEVGLEPFLKTTGGKGLHLVAPLRPTQPWDTVKDFARALARQLAVALPDRFTANMAKARRERRIFVDYLRNGNGATAVAAFSARARDGAPVSMPLSWDALDAGDDLRGARWNIANALEQARRKPDPWADYAASRRTLGPRMQGRLPRD